MPSKIPFVLRLSSLLPGSDRMLRIPGKHRRVPAARPNRPVGTSHRHSPIPTGPLYATSACSTFPPSLRTDGQTTPLHNLHRQLQSGGRADSGRSDRSPSPPTSPVERIATATLAGNRKEIPRRKSRSASALLRPQHSLPFPADDKRQIHKKPPQDSGPAEASVR